MEKRERMKKAGLRLAGAAAVLFAVVMLAGLASAATNYCCEKTTYGAWCQNDVKEKCDASYKMTPTSCESTSFCKRGCCFDSSQGLCLEGTPQRICADGEGTWADDAECNIKQCQLGCCILGGQAAFVTATRCKAIAGLYGIEQEFKKDITDETACIAEANAADIGACVFEEAEFGSLTCKFTTRKECTQGEFHKDILCSAPDLGTVCGRSKATMLVDGKDGVYWKDTCGNPANIYDADKYEDDDYWSNVVSTDESCGAGSSNANSRECGNCDYFLGSIGKEAGLRTSKPVYGDYICADLSCSSEGKKHGQSWCISDKEDEDEAGEEVGSRYFKQVCMNGEVLVEPCSDYRNEICLETKESSSGFTEAGCVVNRWQNCIAQTDKDDCLNYDSRDCVWKVGWAFGSSGSGNTISVTIPNYNFTQVSQEGELTTGICLPGNAPGFKFWNSDSSSSSSSSSTTNSSSSSSTTTSSVIKTTGSAIRNFFSSITGSAANENVSGTTSTFGSATSSVGTGTTAAYKASMSPTYSCSVGDAAITFTFQRDVKAFGKEGNWQCYEPYNLIKHEICESAFDDGNFTDPEAFYEPLNEICTMIGDCGEKTNWVGESTEEGYAVYWGSKRLMGAGGSSVLSSTTVGGSSETTTGSVVADFFRNINEKFGGGDEGK